jgi:hypothetical protein
MVEAQVRRWTLRRSRRWESLGDAWPVVTISREPGDQGPALGRALAQRLGFGYWNGELVGQLARLLRPDSASAIPMNEQTRDAVEAFVGDTLPRPRGVSAEYSERIRQIISSIACRGGAVLLGRGAQSLVDGRRALRVHLATSSGFRSLAPEVAEPADFDLVVNSGSYDRQRAVGLVLMAYLAKFGDWPSIARSFLASDRRDSAPVLRANERARSKPFPCLMDEELMRAVPTFANAVKSVVKLA